MFPVRAAGLALGVAADAVFADPQRGHPVALFGRTAAALERRCWGDSRRRGAAYTAVCVGVPVLAGAGAGRLTRGRPVLSALLLGAATWTALGGTSLAREGDRQAGLLAAGDVPGSRERLSYLCARDARELDAAELARATVESMAENTSDAVVAPLLWALVGGVPGVLGYRAVNTLDAMVGYRSERYARFGWAAARLDDLANLAPSRLTAVLTVAAAPLAGGSARRAWTVWHRDGSRHPSPNAGQCEAAFAGALDVRLGGTNRYGDHAETRGVLGDGAVPAVADIARSTRLARLVGAAAGATVILAAVTVSAARQGARRMATQGSPA